MDNMPMSMDSSPPMPADHSTHVSHAALLSYSCDGKAWMDMGPDKASSWATHFLPGLALLFWAMHTNFGVFRAYLLATKSSPYRASTTYTVPFLNSAWPVEGLLKIFVPFISILTQLWWAHGHWSSNMCPEGTPRAGHFWPEHIYSWQNAWVLFTFMASGMVDVVAHYMELPEHTQHFFASAAFMMQSFILAESEHPDMLEDMIYFLLFLAAAGTSISMLVEMGLPESFWASSARVYGMYMQAIWYFAAARFLFEGRPAWQTADPVPDMAPAMFVPVVYVFWMNMVGLGMLLVFLGMRRWYATHLGESLRSHYAVERTLVAPGMEAEGVVGGASKAKGVGSHEMVPLIGKQF